MFFAWERARVALGFIAASLLVPSGHGIKPCHHANQGEHRCHQGQKAKKNLEHTFTSPIFFHCGTTLWRPKGPVKAASFWQFQFLTHPNGGGGQVVELGNLLPACAVTQFSLSDSPQAVPPPGRCTPAPLRCWSQPRWCWRPPSRTRWRCCPYVPGDRGAWPQRQWR